MNALVHQQKLQKNFKYSIIKALLQANNDNNSEAIEYVSQNLDYYLINY